MNLVPDPVSGIQRSPHFNLSVSKLICTVGVVAVDRELASDARGIHMRLRGSMKKFEHEEVAEAEIEIARAFERPNTTYMNRYAILSSGYTLLMLYALDL